MIRRLVLTGLGAILASLLLVGWGFAEFLEAASAQPDLPLRPTDGIVVLTGGAQRVETGLRLLDEGLAPRLLVSGAAPGLTLAELARAHGREPEALAGRVMLGHAAATTIGNAAEVAADARAFRLGSLRLVTAGYHMPRARLEIARALPDVLLVPHPVTPALLRIPAGKGQGLPAMRRWTLLFGEYLKYVAATAGVTRFVPAKESARL